MEARPIRATLKLGNGRTALYVAGVYFTLGETYLWKYLIFFKKRKWGLQRRSTAHQGGKLPDAMLAGASGPHGRESSVFKR